MLYLIGLSHNAQVRKRGSSETEEQKGFAALLRNAIRENRLGFIAEEHCEEFLDRQGAVSIAKEIALENGIPHKFCDPNVQQRIEISYACVLDIRSCLSNEDLADSELDLKAQSIEIGRFFPVRERFWLDRISKCVGSDGIFICGDGHIESFTRLLDENQICWKVVARRVGFVPGEGAHVQEAMDYLREHPELESWNI